MNVAEGAILVLDLMWMREISDGDPAFERGLLDGYLADCKANLREPIFAWKRNDLSAWRDAMRAQGSSANIEVEGIVYPPNIESWRSPFTLPETESELARLLQGAVEEITWMLRHAPSP